MRRPKYDTVIDFCIRLLHQDPRRKLPPLRILAKECDVSLKTAHDALTSLKQRGIITARWGDGYYSSEHLSSVQRYRDSRHRKHKIDGLIAHIKADLDDNKFPRGSILPALKVLQDHYQVSYPTIKKVLERLVCTGELRRHGKGYRVPYRISPKPWRLRLLIITASDKMGKLNIQSEQEQTFFRMISAETMNRKLDCSFAGLNEDGFFPVLIEPDTGREIVSDSSEGLIGYVVLARHLKNLGGCLELLTPKQLPIAVWGDEEEIFSHHRKNSRVTFFTIGYSVDAGVKVARHLIGLGHKKVAYISPFHRSRWSQSRLEGLEREYNRSGFANSVRPFVLNEFSNDWSFMDLIYRDRLSHHFLDCSKLEAALQTETSAKISSVDFELKKALRDNLILEKSTHLLRQALSDDTITAWVCANDLCALIYLDYLRSNSISVPRDISIVGYDNTFEALQKGLTSFDFNCSGMANAILDHILAPVNRKGREDTIQMPGEIISRLTTDTIRKKRRDW
ncbi:MAG: substrate-binding domain-containing protein [Chitinispirillaceae bacterium]